MDDRAEMRRGILRWARQMIVMLAMLGAVMYLSSGKLSWAGGWVFLGMNALTQALSAVVLIPRQPAMVSERSKVRKGTKSWDRVLAPLIVIVGTLALLITAGLDARFGWSPPVNAILWGVAITLAFASQMFVLWAMASNPFFAATVRIQSERGQNVVRSGPYGVMRHPGYAGAVIYNLCTPLVLGSWWAYIPALITIALIILRTGLEDRTLQEELPGYQEFAQAVRWKIVPGVW